MKDETWICVWRVIVFVVFWLCAFLFLLMTAVVFWGCGGSVVTVDNPGDPVVDAGCEDSGPLTSAELEDFVQSRLAYGDMCESCVDAQDCDDGRCLFNSISGESFCTLDCSDRGCPMNFFCSTEIPGVFIAYCLPVDVNRSCKELLWDGDI